MRVILMVLLTLSANAIFFQVQVEDHGFLLWWVKFVPRFEIPFLEPQLNYDGAVNKFYIFARYWRHLSLQDYGLNGRIKINQVYVDVPLNFVRADKGNLIYSFLIRDELLENGLEYKTFSFSNAEFDSNSKRFNLYIDLVGEQGTGQPMVSQEEFRRERQQALVA